MTQETIILFPGVEILPALSKQHAMEYLKRYCTIDDLDDTIYVKKLGNDKTTFAIEFIADEINKVRKIKDDDGNNIDEIVFGDIDDEDLEINEMFCDGCSASCDDCKHNDDEQDKNEKTSDDLIVCPECNTKCETEYCCVEADEMHDDEQVPIYSECPKCGWSVC